MIPLPKAKSIKKIKAPKTRMDMNVSTVLSCNSFQAGQVTLFINSSYDSFKYVIIAAITFSFRTGAWTRTKINGFGDRYSTIELRP